MGQFSMTISAMAGSILSGINNTSVPIIIDPSEWVVQCKPLFARGKVGHGPDSPKDPRQAAASQTPCDQSVTEGVGVGLGVDVEVFVATCVDDVRTRPLSGPLEGGGTTPPLF